MSHRHVKLPVAALERIDDACVQFEDDLREGRPRQIEDLLDPDAAPAEREALLAELLVLEFDYRKRRGEQVSAEQFRARFPNEAGIVERVLSECIEATMPSRFEPPSLEEIDHLFPSLEVTELIGAGGMGAVYKARQPGLDRVVAIKVLPEEIGRDVKFALRFAREARALAKLNHPNIVAVYEFGNVGENYYFLMEFVDGPNLRQVIRSGDLQQREALQIVPAICEALQYAHDNGVVHRDIKPENILLDQKGQVKIADFGLSRLVGNESGEEALTYTHQVMGTPRYMAPEQMEGARKVDHRADIYSLGVVFYEMLTGELPLGRFAAPSEKVHIDVRLDDVVLRSLEKEPRRRYQHASDVKSDLESITSQPRESSRESNAGLSVTQTSDDRALGDRMLDDRAPNGRGSNERSRLENQELAGRILLLRRDLIGRIETSMRPLFRGQFIQIFIGVILIGIGASCWAVNQEVPHRFVSGITVHVYGVFVIISGVVTNARISQLDPSWSVEKIREQLDSIRKHYLRAGGLIGFSWWLMWIPLGIAVGFDVIMYPGCLYPSLGIGIVGMAVSLWLYYRVLKRETSSAEKWSKSFTGESLNKAYTALGDLAKMEQA